MRRYTLFLPLQMIARFNALSERTGYKAAELIRRALQSYLDAHDPEGREK